MTAISLSRPGDVVNLLSLALTLGFVVAYFTVGPSLFSPSYLKEGFCVSFKETVFNSHLLCFYVDSVLALIIAAICYLFGKGLASFDRVRENYPGIIGHGIGHLSLYLTSSQLAPNDVGIALASGWQPLQVAAIFTAIFIFWFGFFWSFSESKLLNLFLSVANTVMILFFVPKVFGFTYVQTVLMFCFVSRELLLPIEKKDRWYNLWSIFVPLPVVVVGWIEAIFCDSFLDKYGGHVWYDGIIPLSILLYVIFALQMEKDKVA